jgi:hypothetical protein
MTASRAWPLVIVCAGALALRCLHLATVWPLLAEPPEVGMDRWLQMHVAEAVARGDWLGGWAAEYDSGPGYAYWLGAVHRLSGRSWLGPLLVQALLGSLAPLLLHALGRRLFGPPAGLVAAGLGALYGPTIFYEILLVKFALLPVVTAALLVAAVRLRESASLARAFLAGLALGGFVVLRGNGALAALAVLAWAAATLPTGRRVRVALAVVAGAAVLLGPLAVRDRAAAVRGRGTSLWGIHFYIGNNLEADGTYTLVEGVRDDIVGHVVDARRVAEAEAGRALSPFEVSAHWLRKGLAFIGEHPGRYLALQARKLRLALRGGEEGSFGDEFADMRDASWVLRLPLVTFGAMCPLALLGLVVVLARRRAVVLPLFVGTYLLSLLPFFVSGRYRLPLVAPMLVLAAAGISWVDEAVRTDRHRALLGATALAGAGLAGLLNERRDPWTFLGVLVFGLGVVALARRHDAAGGQSTR